MAEDEKDAAAKKRSEAAKKAAATRKKNEQAAGPRGGRKIGKAQKAQGPRGGRKVGKTGDQAEGLDYKPKRVPLENAGVDQHSLEEKRQAELADEREEHNRRTGDGSLPKTDESEPRGGRKIGKTGRASWK